MRLRINGTQRRLGDDEVGQVERQVLFALSRFDTLIHEAEVTVDIVGPAKECRVRLKLRSGPDVASSDRNSDLASAARQAASRLASALDRQLRFTPESVDRVPSGMRFGD